MTAIKPTNQETKLKLEKSKQKRTREIEDSKSTDFHKQIKEAKLVDPPAILPDLSFRSSKGTDVTHLNHGSHQISSETAGVVAV